jgi:alginate O-acetyltransferase complex protein AlgI
MVFSSIEFLFLFLPVVLLAYRLTPGRVRNGLLMGASALFYTWGGGAFVLILAASIVVDYCAGWMVDVARERDLPRRRAAGILLSVLVNVGLLGYFKYANFFVDQWNALGIGTIAWTNVALPIGISFFTFQSMSYTIDVARGRARHLRNPVDFALYVSLFPQLIAGPIVRYHEIADQLRGRVTRLEDFAEGVLRFSHGLVKKVVVADAVAPVADAAFGLGAADLTTTSAWVGVAAYTIQIYFDFSGYSDMAIGLGRMFGFTFPENFRRPYSALSVTDFWRRWHITLSNWFRDYLYVPLGGNRGRAAVTYRNLVIVFLLTGFWHGANWTFLVWGAYHGGLLIVERLTGQRPVRAASLPWLRRAVTLVLVMAGWAIFRADSIWLAGDYLRAMFTWQGGGLAVPVADALTTKALLTLVAAWSVVLLPGGFVGGVFLARSPARWAPAARFAVLAVALPYAVLLVASGTFSPFLYFQF